MDASEAIPLFVSTMNKFVGKGEGGADFKAAFKEASPKDEHALSHQMSKTAAVLVVVLARKFLDRLMTIFSGGASSYTAEPGRKVGSEAVPSSRV